MDWKHEEAVNVQICAETTAAYVYEALWAYFIRTDVALPGIAAFFRRCADEEREHARLLCTYQTKRGGVVQLMPIDAPTDIPKQVDALTAFTIALELEISVNTALLELHAEASNSGDAHLAGYVESTFLGEQTDAIAELTAFVTRLTRIGPDGTGLEAFDASLSSTSQ